MTPSKINEQTKSTVQHNNTPAKSTDLEAWLDNIVKTNKRRRASIEEPHSVQSNLSANYSDDSSATDTLAPTKKRRGRPPKTSCSMPSPSQFSNLDEKDYRYQEMRHKNNEASRRSRLNRKEKEDSAMNECNKLEQTYESLCIKEKNLKRQVYKLRAALMKLALQH